MMGSLDRAIKIDEAPFTVAALIELLSTLPPDAKVTTIRYDLDIRDPDTNRRIVGIDLEDGRVELPEYQD